MIRNPFVMLISVTEIDGKAKKVLTLNVFSLLLLLSFYLFRDAINEIILCRMTGLCAVSKYRKVTSAVPHVYSVIPAHMSVHSTGAAINKPFYGSSLPMEFEETIDAESYFQLEQDILSDTTIPSNSRLFEAHISAQHKKGNTSHTSTIIGGTKGTSPTVRQRSSAENTDTDAWVSTETKTTSNNNNKLRQIRKKVIIYSLPRSGSSFLGQLFNIQPSSFYMYEPLHALKIFQHHGLVHNYDQASTKMLSKILDCNFRGEEDLLNFISEPGLSNPHYRLMSRTLSSPPFCTQEIPQNSSAEYYREHCTSLNPVAVRLSCSRCRNVFVKDLIHRLPHRSVTGLMALPSFDAMHVVCLVRDPRAVLWSMQNLNWFGNHYGAYATDISSAVTTICKLFSDNYRAIERYSSVLHNLVVLRYEDLVSNPVQAATALFEFLDMDLGPGTESWLLENTHGQLDGRHPWREYHRQTSYSVSLRNVTHSLNFWRRGLAYRHVQAMQRQCGQEMKNLGYTMFTSEADLDDLSIPAYKETSILENLLVI